MFIARAVFWLGTVVMLLPPSAEGEPPPRVSVLHAAVAARALITDLGSVCQRNPAACVTSGQALVLVGRKLETGTDIVAAGIAAARADEQEPLPPEAHGTLKSEDLQAGWVAPPG